LGQEVGFGIFLTAFLSIIVFTIGNVYLENMGREDT